MALPALRTNRVLNPVPASTTGFSNSGGAGTWTYNTSESQPFARFTKDGTPAATGFLWGSVGQITGAIGTIISFRLWVRCSSAVTLQMRNNLTNISGSAPSLSANVWTEVVLENHAVTVADFRLGALIGTVPAAATVDFKLAIVEAGATCSSYFSGATVETGWKHLWTGTANASTSTREVSGIWLDGLTGAPGPRVQVTAVDLGGTAVLTQVTRESDGVTWTVPGWKAKNSLTAETWTDWFPPLNRPVTYTLFVNGQAFNSRTIQVDSTVGYIVDPLQPDGALPVDVTDTGVLHLSHAALVTRQLKFRGKMEYPVGGRYPIASAGPRSSASGLDFVINAPSTALADQLEEMAEEAPILLFRPLPSWGRLPGVCYVAGDVAPTFFHRGAGGRFSQWSIGGELVAPVTRAAVTGTITNDMVATNLAGRTNTSIATASAWRRHIDIKANPLGLGS